MIGFSYAFQPIVDTTLHEVRSYEALIRGPRGEPAGHVFAQVPRADMARFDRESRVTAVATAGRLGVTSHLNLNVLPGSLRVHDPMRSVIDMAHAWRIPLARLVLEITEDEVIDDRVQFAEIVDAHRALGMQVAIDDFGAGHSGLNLLADFQPDLIKLDMHLVRGIESSGPRQSIVRAIAMVCGDLGIDVVAEGVETIDEHAWLADEGVHLFQGYLFGRPSFEALPSPAYPPGVGVVE